MLKLHGLSISNYYNIVKMGLLEKGLEFEEVAAQPGQDADWLVKSPMGKIPVLETEGQFISESNAILRYLALKYPEPALYPKQPLAAAKSQQIHSFLDCYIDAPGRTLIGAAFLGETTTPEKIAEVGAKIARGAKALNQIAVFGPFIAGETLTHADLAAVQTIPLATQIMKHVGAEDPCTCIEGFKDYLAMMKQRASVQKIYSDRAALMAKMFGG